MSKTACCIDIYLDDIRSKLTADIAGRGIGIG